MKKKLKWIIIFLIIGILIAVITMDMLYYYPEKFAIASIEARLFEVEKDNKSSGCYIVKEVPMITDTNKIILIGFKFKVDYVSLKHEHLFDKTKDAYGAQGHIDSIVSLQFVIGRDNKAIDSRYFKDASSYKYFKPLQGEIINHHMTARDPNCYVAQTFRNPDEFVENYNSSSLGGIVSSISDYHFYQIDPTILPQFVSSDIHINMVFADGKKLKSK